MSWDISQKSLPLIWELFKLRSQRSQGAGVGF